MMVSEIGLTDKLFNLAEAEALLPLVQVITKNHQSELAPIQVRLNKMLSNDPRRKQLEYQYENIVSRWRTKIQQLGAAVSGLWVVEFNVGEGALSWKYPELTLCYFRAKYATFSERAKLTDYIEENDPDWVR